MQVVDKYGNTFGQGHLIITSKSGKSKLPVVTVAWGNITGALIDQTDLQDALNLKVPTARTITINGVTQDLTANRTWTISTGITVDTTPITGGVAGRVLFEGVGNVVQESPNFLWDNTNGRITVNAITNGAVAIFKNSTNGLTIYPQSTQVQVYSDYFGAGTDKPLIFGTYSNRTNQLSLFTSGNIGVNTTTDAGFRLDVNGTARVTSLTTADIFPATSSISLWTNSLNASSRFYTAPVHQDGRINFNAIAGGNDQVLIRAWHTGMFGLGTGSSAAGSALTVRGDSLLIGTSGALYFMNGTFGPNNVPYRLAISTNATTAAFYSGVGNNLTNIESTKFEFAATSHTFYTGTTTGNQSNPNQFIPLHLSNLGNVTIGSTTDAGFRLDVAGTGRFQGGIIVSNPSFTGQGSIAQAGNNTTVITGRVAGASENITFGPSNRIFINAGQSRFPSGSVQIGSTLTVGNSGNASTVNMLYVTGGISASFAIARGQFIDTALTASANNDVLVGLDIASTYTNGAFTGLTNIDLRTKGIGLVIGSGVGYGALYGYNNDGVLQVVDGGTSALSGYGYATQLWLRPSGNASGLNSNYWATIEQSTGGLFIQSGRYNSNIFIKTGRAGTSGNIYFNNAGGTMAMFFGATANLGIGTTTDAGYKLDINGASRTLGTHRIWRDNAVAEIKLELYGGQSGWESSIYHNIGAGGADQRLTFRVAGSTSAADRMSILTNGNVGIGTTNPTYNLEVVSSTGYTGIGIRSAQNNNAELSFQNAGYPTPRWTIRASAAADGSSGNLVFQRNASTFPMTITSGDNVLIGTTTDVGYKLDVNGASIYRESLTNTTGGFIHKSTSPSNDAFWSVVSGSVYFYVSAGGYCKTTSNLVTAATGVGTINASAISQIDSVTKGFLPPRMTNAQMLAIATPAEGLMVYDTTNRKLCCYDGATWQNLF